MEKGKFPLTLSEVKRGQDGVHQSSGRYALGYGDMCVLVWCGRIGSLQGHTYRRSEPSGVPMP